MATKTIVELEVQSNLAEQAGLSKQIKDNLQAAGTSRVSMPVMAARQGVAAAESREYGTARSVGPGTGAEGRDFAKQAQGLGGLVHVYATFAANIFAVSAAYEALNKAAGAERLAKATEMMSISTGVHLKSVSKNLEEASGYALSFNQAMQFTNMGVSAGLASKQIENLTKIAKGAANALNRDVGESVQRIIQGTVKQEQEILDELGIFLKANQAFSKYAQQFGLNVSDLTGQQRTQAYANEVERLGEKWKSFAEIPDPFGKFSATAKNALNDLLKSINKVLSPVLDVLSQSESAIKAIIAIITTSLARKAIPELGNVLTNLFTVDKTKITAEINSAQKALEIALAENNRSIAKFTAERNKLLVPQVTPESIRSAIGSSAYVKGAGGQEGASVERITSGLIGTTKNPKLDLTGFRTLEDIQNNITNSLTQQVKESTRQDVVLKGLIDKQIISKDSTKEKLVLDEQGIIIAKNLFNQINAQNTSLDRQVIVQRELAQLEATRAEITTSMSAYTTGKSTPKLAAADVAEAASTNVSTAATNANTAAQDLNNKVKASNSLITLEHAAANSLDSVTLVQNTIGTEKNTLAGLKLQASLMATAVAIKIKSAATASDTVATASMALAIQKGLIPSLYETTISLYRSIAALIAFGSAGATFSAVISAVSLTMKGLIATLNLAIVPILAVITVWELFGETIKSWFGYDAKAAAQVEESAKKYKEYAEGLALAGASRAMLNEQNKLGAESGGELAQRANKELTLANELAEMYSKLAKQQEQSAKIDDLRARQKNGEIINAEGYLIRQELLREGLSAEAKQKLELIKIDADKLAWIQLSGKYTEKEIADAQKLSTINKSLAEFKQGEIPALNQKASLTEKYNKAQTDLTSALDEGYKAQQKLGDPKLNLNNETAVKIYNSLKTALTSNIDAGIRYKETAAALSIVVERGGKSGDIARTALLKLNLVYDNLGNTSLTAAQRSEMLNEALKDTAGIAGTLASSFNTLKVIEYSNATKAAFISLASSIKGITAELRDLDLQMATTSNLENRVTALQGYSNELLINTQQFLANEKAIKEYDKTVADARLAKLKVTEKTGASKEEKSAAIDAEAAAEAQARFTKELAFGANMSAAINKINTAALGVIKEKYAGITRTAEETRVVEDGRLQVETTRLGILKELGIYSETDLTKKEQSLEKQKIANSLANELATIERQRQQAQEEFNVKSKGLEGTPEAIKQQAELTAGFNSRKVVAESLNATAITNLNLTGAQKLAQAAVTDELKKSATVMTLMKDITTELANVFGTVGEKLGKVGESLLKTSQDSAKFASDRAKLEKIAGDPETEANDRMAAIEAIKKSDKEKTKSELSNMGAVAGATKNLFKEKTFAYKAFAAFEKAMSVLKLATMAKEIAGELGLTAVSVTASGTRAGAKGTESIVNAMKDLPTPLNFAAGAAMAVIIAKLLGGGSEEINMTGMTSADRQETQGTGMKWVGGQKVETGGGVFGDTSAKSESIKNSLEIIKSTSVEGLSFSNEMVDLLTSIDKGISGVAKGVYGVVGIRTGSQFGTQEGSSGSNILGGLFGSSRSTQITDSGLQLKGSFTEFMDNVEGITKGYEDVLTTSTSSFLWSKRTSQSLSRNVKDLDDALTKSISNVFDNAGKLFVVAGTKLGMKAEDVLAQLANVSVDKLISLRGLKGADLEKELAAVLGSILDDTSNSLFAAMKDFQEFGEGMLQTVMRVTDGFDKVNLAMTSIGKSSISSGIAGMKISESLISAAGGLKEFLDKTKSFADNFLTETERLVPVQAAVNKELNTLGYESNLTKDQIKNIILSFQTVGDTSSTTYIKLLDLSESINTLETASKAAIDKLDDFDISIYTELGKAEKALQLTREKELRALDASLRPIQKYLNALKDESTVKSKIATAYKDQSAALKTTITGLKTSIKTLKDYKTALTVGASSLLTPAEKYAQAKSTMLATASLARKVINASSTAEDIAARDAAVSQLSSTSDAFLASSREMFASSDRYSQDFATVLEMLDASSSALDAQMSDAEKQQTALDASVSFLDLISTSTDTTATLLAQLLALQTATETARLAAVEAGSSAAATVIPAMAGGGIANGLTLVGENGPELANFSSAARVYSNKATNDIFNTKELVAEIRSLRAEVSQLRADQKVQTGHLIAANYDANAKNADAVAESTDAAFANQDWKQRSQVKIA